MMARMAVLEDTQWIAQREIMGHLLAVLGGCEDCDTIEDLKNFIRTELRAVFAHDMAMCGLCNSRTRRVLRLINVDFPVAYLERIVPPDQIVLDGPLRQWLSERSPIVRRIRQTSPCGVSADRDYGIASFACHGVVDLSGVVSSYFAFARLDFRVIPHERELLGLIVPHLHEALARLLTRDRVGDGDDAGDIGPELPQQQAKPRSCIGFGIVITERECEILRWIAAGKTNWEIGKILQISEFTVKNHVQSILKKLSANSRAQAVTMAISAGLIGEETRPLSPRRRMLPDAAGSGRAARRIP
jgi:DNA-binding CsgD family transcriptional regulator